MEKLTISQGAPPPFLTLTQRSTLWESCQQKNPNDDQKHFLTEPEFKEFAEVVERRRLDPFTRQIYWTKRWVKSKGRHVIQVEATIDGLRLIAERTGQYAGQKGPFWTNGDKDEKTGQVIWLDVWIDDDPPKAARIGILRKGFDEPLWGVANWKAYVQTYQNGNVSEMWKKMDAHMLAKVAEALGFRKAFPQDTSGLLIREESQAAAETEKAEDKTPEAPPDPDATDEDGEVLTLTQWRAKVRKAQKAGEVPDTKMKDHCHLWVGKRYSKDFSIEDCRMILKKLDELLNPEDNGDGEDGGTDAVKE